MSEHTHTHWYTHAHTHMHDAAALESIEARGIYTYYNTHIHVNCIFHFRASQGVDMYFADIHSSFEDVRVNTGHSVDSVGTHNAQMGHVDPLLTALLDEGHAAQTLVVTGEVSGDSLKGFKEHEEQMYTCVYLFIYIVVYN